MTMARYRAFRFAAPDMGFMSVDAATTEAGLSLSGRGVAMTEESASVRQAILLLLSTTPGERVMRPDYGCEIKTLIFSPNDDTTAGLAIHYVRRALMRWEPRIRITRLDAERSPHDPSRLDIHLEYVVRAVGERFELVYPVFLAGAP